MRRYSLAPAHAAAGLLILVLSTLGCARRPATGGGPSAATSTAHSASATAPVPSTGPHAKGAALYERYCTLCHGKDATGYAADNAPSLVSRTFLESADDAFIAAGIRLGRPGTAMGAYGKIRSGPLDDADIQAIVSFLRARGPASKPLPTSSQRGDAVRGATLYPEHCASCHGTEAERKTALSLFNPELLAAASADFLRYAIVHGRPPTPMPAFETLLTPTDIEDLVAWLGTKRKATPAASASAQSNEVPKDLPVLINPKGRAPSFTLREERFVSVDAVKKALAERRRMVIVDARSPADWLDFHIPGAISAPYYNTAELGRIPNDGTWVIAYCACPHHASGAVVDALRAKGYKNTAVLDEGIIVWKTRGYPLAGQTKQ
jgi:cytochrome c oxidase cbb3-type subunit 3/ubiquinol-cytochrome c reductase cytochrome c subunit